MLVGGDGADILKGKGGRDLLIGGLGADKLNGGRGEDILVGGMTRYDAVEPALAAILDEWTSDRPYNRRRVNILVGGGLNGANVFNPVVAPNDRMADELTGGLDRDWFWVFVPPDKLTDRASPERVR